VVQCLADERERLSSACAFRSLTGLSRRHGFQPQAGRNIPAQGNALGPLERRQGKGRRPGLRHCAQKLSRSAIDSRGCNTRPIQSVSLPSLLCTASTAFRLSANPIIVSSRAADYRSGGPAELGSTSTVLFWLWMRCPFGPFLIATRPR